MLDGQPPHGFKVDGSLNVVSNNPSMGLREIIGNDPQSDSFSLGQGTPQVWGPQRAQARHSALRSSIKLRSVRPVSASTFQRWIWISMYLVSWNAYRGPRRGWRLG